MTSKSDLLEVSIKIEPRSDGETSDSAEYDSDHPSSRYVRRILKLQRRQNRAKMDDENQIDDTLKRKRELTNARVKKYREKKRAESQQLNSSMQNVITEEMLKQLEENNAEHKRALAKERSRRYREKKRLNVDKSAHHGVLEPTNLGVPLVIRENHRIMIHDSHLAGTSTNMSIPLVPCDDSCLQKFNDEEVSNGSTLIAAVSKENIVSAVNNKQVQRKQKTSTPVVILQSRKSLRLGGRERAVYSGLEDGFGNPSIRKKRFCQLDSGVRRIKNSRARLRLEESNPDALSGSVAYNSNKVYSSSGTTCHQCRQKTIDLKSQCFGTSCSGVRGQFCGYCLLGRYGEDVAVILRDKNWKCPPCRGICNCSICRRQNGKPPTGQLKQIAHMNGYSSVVEYLEDRGDSKLIVNDKFENETTDIYKVHIKQEPVEDDALYDPIDLSGLINLQPWIKVENC